MHPVVRQASRVLKRASTMLSPRNYLALMGIGIAGVLLRYGAYYFETGDLSLTGYVGALCQWDCRLYNELAYNGYESSAQPDGGANWAFFPLFPIMLSLFHFITGLSFIGSGAVLSQCCIGLAAAFARPLFKNDISGYWVFCTLLIAGPLSFYYSTGLTEALFVMLTVIVLVCLQRGNYLAAGVAAGLLSATRVTGIFIVLPIMVQTVIDYRRGTRTIGRALVALLLAPIGLIAFMIYLYVHVGDPLAFVHVQSVWGRSLHSPFFWMQWGLRRGSSGLGFWLIVTAMGALTMCVVMALRGALGAALFCAASLTLALSTGPDSMPRFVAGLVPLTITTAQILPGPLAMRLAAVTAAAALGVYATMKWVGGHAQFLV
jgi:hypothetical protein